MREEYNRKDIDVVSKFDFFGGNNKDFLAKIKTRSYLAWGSFSQRIPLITIVITTYKRVETLTLALDSALNQRNFDDYEILVVDNEGVDIREETETSRYIQSLDSDKVIYYRHENSVGYSMDHACNLARTKWIMFLHDDDILNSDALYILYNVAKERPQFSWISCTSKEFRNSEQNNLNRNVGQGTVPFNIKCYPPQYSCTGYVPGWLGALIDREKFINIGGMPSINLGMGDYVMQGCYANRYKNEVCWCKTEISLYYYRVWEKQLSSNGTIEWYNNYINQFIYYRYCAKKYHKITKKYWEYIGWQIIKDAIADKNNGFYQCNISEEKMRALLKVPQSWCRRGVVYKMSNCLLIAYRKYWLERMKKDDGFIVVP